MSICDNLILILESEDEMRQIYDANVWRKSALTLPHLSGRFPRTVRSFIPRAIAFAVDIMVFQAEKQ